MPKKMVSKSGIRGKPFVIFVTIGTTLFAFERLFSTIDALLVKGVTKPKLIVQSGNSRYVWKYPNTIQSAEYSVSEMAGYFKIASHIITHGGFGTMYQISHNSKIMPLVVARLSKYQEHVDDHQKYFLDYCKEILPQNHHPYLITEERIDVHIKNYIYNIPTQQHFKQHLFTNKFSSYPKLLNQLFHSHS